MFFGKVIVHDVYHSYVRIISKIVIRLKLPFEWALKFLDLQMFKQVHNQESMYSMLGFN
jgi:hypothetical protein